MTRTCRRCEKNLPIESFGIQRGKPGDRRAVCRECRGRYGRGVYGVAGPRTKSHDQRVRDFWALVEKSSSCWNWVGRKTTGGYGHTSYENRDVLAHRLAWFIVHGSWPKMLLCHRCDNPLCVRMSHLFEGTQADNMQDASRKGRLGNRSINYQGGM